MDEQHVSQQNQQHDHPFPSSGSADAAAFGEYRSDLKHSGPGIASFIIAMVSIIGYVIAFAVAGSMLGPLIDEAGGLTAGTGGAFLMLGLSVLALGALNVIGTIVGIIGLAIRRRRKVFGIIGTIINGLIVLGFVLIMGIALVEAGTL